MSSPPPPSVRPRPGPARWPGCWSPTSPGSWPALLHHAAGRPRRRRDQGRGARRRRHPALAAARHPRAACPPITWPSTGTSGRSCWTCAPTPAAPPPPSWPGGPTSWSRTSSPAAWPGSAWTTTTVSAANPAVIYASITGFGSGAGPDLPGYDLIVQAVSGLMSLTGAADGPPYRAGVALFDVMAGLHATIGILAALAHRTRHRRGPARRGQPAGQRHVRAGQPGQRGAGRRASSRCGWATPTPACSRTSRCRRPTARSSSRPATTPSSAGCAR